MSKNLKCGCCGEYFTTWFGYVDQDQDKGWGICEGCQKWISEADTKRVDEIIKAVSDALSPKNKRKFDAMDREMQESVCVGLFEDGIIEFKIERRI